MQEHERRPGRRWPPRGVVDRVPAERGAHLLAREVLRQVLVGRGPEQEQGVGDPRAVAGGEPAELGELARAQPPRIGRRGVEQREDQLRDLGQPGLEPGQGAGVGGAEPPDPLLGLREVVVEMQRRAVGEQVEGGTRRIDLDSALDQAQVAPDRLAQHAEYVGARRRAVAGRELLGDAAAADDLAALADKRPHSRPREVEPGDEAVVAAADDQCVPGGAVRAHVSSCLIFASRYAITAKMPAASSIRMLIAAPPLRSPLSSTRSFTALPSM